MVITLLLCPFSMPTSRPEAAQSLNKSVALRWLMGEANQPSSIKMFMGKEHGFPRSPSGHAQPALNLG